MINLPHSMPVMLETLPLTLPVAPQAPLFTPYPSDSDIIPNEVQDRLIFWRDVFKTGQFDIGDNVAKVIIYNAERGMRITHGRIFQAISTFCGKTPRTVRYYYETAVFYPSEVRQQYDALPFSHFVEARMFGDSWRDYLETAMLNPHRSPEYIRNIFLAPQTSQLLTFPGVAAPLVAVGVAVGVGAEVSNSAVSNSQPRSEAGENKKNICELSQEMTGEAQGEPQKACEVSQDYLRHKAICAVDEAVTALNEVIPIIEFAPFDNEFRHLLMADCTDVIARLQKLGKAYAHAGDGVI